MARNIFDKYAKPKKDLIKSLILERINALQLDNAAGCKMMGVCENTYIRRINHQHTDEWKVGEVLRMCKGLKVDIDDLRGAVRR